MSVDLDNPATALAPPAQAVGAGAMLDIVRRIAEGPLAQRAEDIDRIGTYPKGRWVHFIAAWYGDRSGARRDRFDVAG
jgi:hypothetical protein